ncbi:glycosyltransferase [soil metagenome]
MDPQPPVTGAPTATGEVPDLPATIPSVVAVMVTHDPGPWFEETLESLAAQTYPDLSLLVIDTASHDDPTERVHAVVPTAHIHRLDRDPGYGAAANLVTDLVEGASFYALCHDDIALEPASIRSLVEEAFRSNAGIIGPKLVEWHEPRSLLQVGMGVDKTGVLAPITERRELDQEQHDAVRDVFVVPGGCTVVRADLFEALGGHDEAIDFLGDDVDLCWRAHVLGARVVIAPAARVRHLEALGERRQVDDRRRRFARHRLRTTLVCYGRLHRLRVLPQAVVFTVMEALYAQLSGHPEQARDVLGAWPWNLRRLPEIRRRRARLAHLRRVKDREIRGLQVRGSARFSGFLRGQFGDREDRVATFARSSRDLVGALRDSSRQLAGAFAVLLALFLLVSSRGLLFDGIPAIGELARFPDHPRDFLGAWWSGWYRAGLGGPGAQPAGYGLLGLAGYGTFGAMGFLRAVLILGTIPVGAFGAWRLARPIASTRASVAAFAVYLAIPVPYNALARGSWSGLAVYAASPWLLLVLGRASGIAPFGPDRADTGDRSAGLARRRAVPLILGLGLLLAVVAAFVPGFVPVALGVTTAIVLGSLFCFRVAGVVRLVLIAGGAVIVAVALHVPWSVALLRSESPWESVAGLGSREGGQLGLGEILRFESGPWGAPPLGWAFLLAGVLPVVIGRSWRLEWAVRSWFVVLLGWGLLYAGQEGGLPFGLPAAEVVLAPVAAALALSAALGLAAFETDLRAHRFGWRQVLAVAASLGVVLGAVPLASGLLDGRWRMPVRSYNSSLEGLVTADVEGAFRVLWVGDAEVLPATAWRYDDEVAYSATDGATPTVLDRLASYPPGATELLADSLRLADERRTTRLGHLLGPMGVRYIVVPTQLAPSSDPDEHPAPAELLEVLTQQLDLERVPVRDGLVVYRNPQWVPRRAVLPSLEGDRTDFTEAVADDLSDAEAALVDSDAADGAVGARGDVPVNGDLFAASTHDPDWELDIAGVPMAQTEGYGWGNQFTATRTGPGELRYDVPFTRHLATGGQAGLWALVVVVRRRARNAERRPTPLSATVVADGERP